VQASCWIAAVDKNSLSHLLARMTSSFAVIDDVVVIVVIVIVVVEAVALTVKLRTR